jgi:enolase-phosphatase E1
MIHFAGRGILLDIDGTTSPWRFAREVLVPYALDNLQVFLRYRWNLPALPRIREELARHFGAASFDRWTGGTGMPPEHRLKQLRESVAGLIKQDSKIDAVRQLQGLICKEGYRKGLLKSQVYPDVIPAFKGWKEQGMDVRLYSFRSKEAQKLFFQHVDDAANEEINLARFLSGYFDATSGPRQESATYRKMAESFQLPPEKVLFVGSVAAELDAARQAGLQTALVRRADHAAGPEQSEPIITSERDETAPSAHPVITTLHDIVLEPALSQ